MCSSGEQSTFELLMPRGSRNRSFVLHFLCYAALLRLRKGTYCRISDQPSSRCQKNRFKTLSPDLGRESLLRSVDYNESVLMAFRVQEIMDKELFVALDTTEEALRRTCKVPSAMTLPRASLTNASRRKW